MRVTLPPVDGSVTLEDMRPIRLFDCVDDLVLTQLLPHCRLCKLEKRKQLHLEIEGKRRVYIILEGYVTVRVDTHELEFPNFLGWRGPGQILGEMGVLCHEPSEATLKTTDPCRFMEIVASELIATADKQPLLYKNLARLLIQKNFEDRLRSEVLQMGSALRQVAKCLVNLIEARGYEPNTHTVSGSIRQVDIAGYIGSRVRAVNLHMQELREGKIISYGGEDVEDGRIQVLDERRLRSEAKR